MIKLLYVYEISQVIIFKIVWTYLENTFKLLNSEKYDDILNS